MAGRRKGISTSDSKLFRQSVGPVSEIRQDKHFLPAPQSRSITPVDKSSASGKDSGLPDAFQELGMGDVLLYRRPGIQQRLLNRLRKGQYAMDGQLDLHGMTGSQGRKRLLDYLEYCSRNGFRCIRVIHGKGHGSPDKKPVIKNMLNNELRRNNSVLAFCSAPANDGGTGVAYVLLKRQGENNVNDN